MAMKPSDRFYDNRIKPHHFKKVVVEALDYFFLTGRKVLVTPEPVPVVTLRASQYLSRRGVRYLSAPHNFWDRHETNQIAALEEKMMDVTPFIEGTRDQLWSTASQLHRFGWATAMADTGEGSEPHAFVIYDDIERDGDRLLRNIAQMKMDEPIGAHGVRQANRFRNFWYFFKVGLALNEAMPDLLGLPRRRAIYQFFREAQDYFAFNDDGKTGKMLFHAHALNQFSDGPYAFDLLTGFMDEGFARRVKLETLCQLIDADGTLEFPAAKTRERLKTVFQPAQEEITKDMQNAAQEIIRRRMPLHNPERMARRVSKLMEGQIQVDRSVERAPSRLADRVTGLGAKEADVNALQDAPRGELFRYAQLFLTVRYIEGLEALLGTDGKKLLSNRALASKRFLTLAARPPKKAEGPG